MNIMFQPQFEPLIVSGTKLHTVRPLGKSRLRVGMALSLRVWTGKPYRSKQREFLKSTVKDVCRVIITDGEIHLDNVQLSPQGREEFAHNDGFKDFAELRAWFVNAHGLPFVGKVIYWSK